jgi:hypothetical protein
MLWSRRGGAIAIPMRLRADHYAPNPTLPW